MAKIIDPDDLVVGTEITIDTTAKTFTLNVAWNLIAKDWVTLQAVYSKFVDLWTTDAYNRFQFPMYTIDAKSGQFQFGTDGSVANGWKPANDATRQMMRDGWWSEFSNAWVLQRQYVGIVSLGDVNTWAQLYYQRDSADAPSNFTFVDEVNEGIQVFWDASNGNFDKRAFFKWYVREYAKKYKSSTLADTGQSSTGAFLVNLLLSNEDDLKIQANDATVAANTPYTSIDVEYLVGVWFSNAVVWSLALNDVRKDTAWVWFICTWAGTIDVAWVANYTTNWGTAVLAAYSGDRSIGGVNYPFSIIIDGANATAEQIYTKVQYLLRQATDIDSGAGTVTGKTANELLYFVGDTLYTTQWVYIDNFNSNDINRIVFTDQNSVQRTFPYTSAWYKYFNPVLFAGWTGYYRMYFTDLAGALDYGASWAITVNDASWNPIAGTITSWTIAFTFAYDSNVQGGRTAWTDAQVTVVAGNPWSAKPVVTNYTITRSVWQGISLVAEQDRAYLA